MSISLHLSGALALVADVAMISKDLGGVPIYNYDGQDTIHALVQLFDIDSSSLDKD